MSFSIYLRQVVTLTVRHNTIDPQSRAVCDIAPEETPDTASCANDTGESAGDEARAPGIVDRSL